MNIVTQPCTWNAPDRTAEEFFWSYVRARQNAWLSRFIDREYPFTHDEIIRYYHFTNVYRETDRHTQYAIWQILDNPELKSMWQVTLHDLVYRLFGSIETYEEIKVLLDGAALGDPDHIEALTGMLAALHSRSGYRVVAAGSQIVGPKASPLHLQLHLWMAGLTDIFLLLNQFIERMMNGTLQECYKLLLTVTGFGPKKAYNTVLDFAYPLKRIGGNQLGRSFDKRAWVLIHGNSLCGLNRMGIKGNDAMLQRAVKALTDKSDSQFPQYLQLHTHNGRTVSLGAYNIVKCLEEWNIYTRTSEGRSNMRQFKPRATNDWVAPSPTLPAYGEWSNHGDIG